MREILKSSGTCAVSRGGVGRLEDARPRGGRHDPAAVLAGIRHKRPCSGIECVSLPGYYECRVVKLAQNWLNRFQSVHSDVKDEPRSGRPVTDKVDAALEKVEQDQDI
ncbi:hypothetical protein EVAR_49826_1 [Eumeta japonica]|uniref:Uncharacterized protein n=1 Tax=Eumeta variegata TaxID=151549 RepID=A0A4C1XPG4_EUMVA|nr:hypothetical protein EVAR_49826_1 [Eumeta japonica]